MRKFYLLLSLLFIVTSGNAFATAANSPPTEKLITVSSAWARLSNANANGAVYMVINNNTNTDQVLVGATAIGVANAIELHNSFNDGGVTKMVKLDNIVIPARNSVKLEPGKIHIMLLDLKANLNTDDKFNLTLQFKDTKSQQVEVVVANTEPKQ